MDHSSITLPYFDWILNGLEAGDPDVKIAFGRHIHWGYWPHPSEATGTPEDFRQAAEQLTQKVYSAAHVSDGQAILDVEYRFGGAIAS
ncbi:MAG: SAM-dependent methyltransferase, partial [Kamptonema sp. SIO4C4]|nr:SAM-dependent methyltransferase [Kamptonema sp. SIO4C4]